jgi:hypothetical protein
MAIWTRQPPYLAPASGLARRLGFTRIVSGFAGANLFEAVTRTFIAPTAGASSITRELTTRGWGARTNGTAAYWEIPFTQSESIANNSTYVWLGRANVSTAIIVRDNSTSGGIIPAWNNAGTFDMRTSGDFTGVAGWTTGVDYCIVCTSGLQTAQLWVDNRLLISGTNTATGNVLAPMFLSRNGSAGPNYDTTTVLFAFAQSRAAAEWAPQLSANPWLLLEAPSPMFAGFTPSVGGSFNAAWARNRSAMIGSGVR